MYAPVTYVPSCMQEVQGNQATVHEFAQNIQEQWHEKTKSLVDRFPYRSLVLFYSFLLLLSIVRWLLVQENMSSQNSLWQTLSTYAIWLAYLVVCAYWLYVMMCYLSCIIVIKRSFRRIWQIVSDYSVLEYPASVILGIVFFTAVALAIVSEVLRYNLSTSKWVYGNNWSSMLGIPLVVVHAIALTCQGSCTLLFHMYS